MKRFVITSLCLLSACQAMQPPETVPTPVAASLSSEKAKPLASPSPTVLESSPTLQPQPSPSVIVLPTPSPKVEQRAPKVQVSTLKLVKDYPLEPGESPEFERAPSIIDFPLDGKSFYARSFFNDKSFTLLFQFDKGSNSWKGKKVLTGHGTIVKLMRNLSMLVLEPYKTHQIFAVDTEGLKHVLTGQVEAGYRDGDLFKAMFNLPTALTTDQQGNIIVLDKRNERIRKILIQNKKVITLAGTGQRGYQDGLISNAQFSLTSPGSIVVDSKNNIYITDDFTCIRKISPEGKVSTFAGVCGKRGFQIITPSGKKDLFESIYSMIIGPNDELYVADGQDNSGGNNLIRKILPDGTVFNLNQPVGTCSHKERDCFQDGPGEQARFNTPTSLSLSKDGKTLLIQDSNNELIRMMTFDSTDN